MDEKKVLKAFTVVYYDNNAIEAVNAGIEGAVQLNNAEIRDSIKLLGYNLILEDIKQAAKMGAYECIRDLNANVQQVEGEPDPQPEVVNEPEQA